MINFTFCILNSCMPYDHRKIEKKWQAAWEKSDLYRAEDFSKKPKFYVLVEFPYPSGAGLHVGHVRSYTALDVVARKLRMQGQNVLYPIGWDAFGLPTENYAIKMKIHPRIATEQNIATFKRQLKSLGLSYDWSREINTTDPKYYKWTQWIFLKFFEKGLAYRAEMPINWCPSCKIGLANEEAIGGVCERCGAKTEKRQIKQWLLKITAYADRLAKDLDTVDYLEKIKAQQIQWIGRSEGYEIQFDVKERKTQNVKRKINVFTTRVDTLYGATFLAIAPEHPLVPQIVTAEQKRKVETYQAMAKAKPDLERTQLEKDKTGIFTGAYAVNPATGKEIPIWVADYVMMNYAEGAIMCVPAHDERDFAFAKKYGLPITEVVQPVYGQPHAGEEERRTITAVVRDPKTDKYLCVKWKKFPWIAPSIGGIDDGETPEQAAVREVREETGYEVKAVRRLGGTVILHFYAENKKVWRKRIDQAILLELVGDQPSETAPEEKEKVEPIWLTRAEMLQKTTHSYNLVGFERLWKNNDAFSGDGIAINSELIDGLPTAQAQKKLSAWLEKKRLGKKMVTYKLHDWIFSRQHYWGEPIPIIHCPKCGTVPVPVKDLPVELPYVKNYQPTGTGESPLAAMKDWVEVKCPRCSGAAKRETDTMPNWAGSSWYFLRYTDPHNDKKFAAPDKLKYWQMVDLYNGGMEHTTLHLLYSRFWNKFLFDLGLVPTSEPYAKRISHGMILAEDGKKMSKSLGNVINPDDVVKQHGADTLRLYEMFLAPFADVTPWSTRGIIGVRRFLERVYNLVMKQVENNLGKGKVDQEMRSLLHRTIRKVSIDVDHFRFNTAISAMMILLNGLEKSHIEKLPIEQAKEIWESFLKILSPFAPHLAEELWRKIGHKKSVSLEAWPTYDQELIATNKVLIIVQVNGKLRDRIEVDSEIQKGTLLMRIRELPKVRKWIGNKKVLKEIYVPGRLVNIVLR